MKDSTLTFVNINRHLKANKAFNKDNVDFCLKQKIANKRR